MQQNLVDLIWTDRPVNVEPPINPLHISFSGKKSSEKISDVRQEMDKLNGTSLLVNALDEIACI